MPREIDFDLTFRLTGKITVGDNLPPWILAFNLWNDLGVWDDAASWKD